MRALITGVSGFVGSRLARHLVERRHAVAGTYIREAPQLDRVDTFEVDLLDAVGLKQVVERSRPEVIVHLAGLSHVGASWAQPAEYFRVNVLGTENLLRAAPAMRLLAASSAEVYGAVPPAEQPIAESRLPAPQSPYALTKAAMERLVLAAGGIVVRAFNIVGPGQAGSFALPAFAGQLAAMREGLQPLVLRVGNLAARRDFLHVDDAAAAYERVLEKGEPGQIYNLGSGNSQSIEQVLKRLIEISELDPALEVDPERFRPVDLPLLQADNRRLRSLGWEPRRSLEEALRDLWCEVLAERASAASSEPAEL